MSDDDLIALNNAFTKIENSLREQIKALQALQTTPEIDKKQLYNQAVKIKLGEKLQEKVDQFFASDKKLAEKKENLSIFHDECIAEIYEADKALKNDKEWKPLLKNLLLLFSGIGTLAAISSIKERIDTGRYAIYDNKEMPQEIKDSAKSVLHMRNTIANYKEEAKKLRTDTDSSVKQEDGESKQDLDGEYKTP